MTGEQRSTEPSGHEIPIEVVATYPFPGMAIPGAFAFGPDDRLVTYLRSTKHSLARQLFAYDLETGEERLLVTQDDGGVSEENLSLDEKLRRERQRQREVGVIGYQWSDQRERILVPLSEGLFVKDGVEGTMRKVVARGDHPPLDPQLSPDGNWVSFVRSAKLFIVDANGGEPRQLTHGAEENGVSHGLAEFIAQEELDRPHGYWWSADSQWLAFTEVDESHIPVYRIVHQGKDAVGEGAQEDHRYPFAGKANARVRLGVVSIEGGEPVWMDLGDDDFYLARVRWLPDGRLAAQRLNREQSRLDLIRFEPQIGKGECVLTETSDVWINLHQMYRPMEDGRFLWASERSGYRHLYLYEADGRSSRTLSRGEWMVDTVCGLDEESGDVYFTATLSDPRESHLYHVPLAGGEICQITQQPGMHAIKIDRAKRHFIDVKHNRGKPPEVALRSLSDGSLVRMIWENDDPRIDALQLSPPELVTLENRQGFRLHAAIYRPAPRFGSGPYPTIVSVYGGPHAQRVTNGWNLTVDMRAQYLRSQGFLVFVLDNRGSARRGLAFEAPIRHNMGYPEVEDQVDGLNWLIAEGQADRERVGVYGWSYGGYMALMCLARAAESFKVAVAGAPVTHWDGYDTGYTERYMGTPQSNPEGYERSSVIYHVESIRGNLLLVHGLIDENVHFRHTARLIDALIRARKPYDLLLFPNERHGPRSLADRIYMEEQIAAYFQRHL